VLPSQRPYRTGAAIAWGAGLLASLMFQSVRAQQPEPPNSNQKGAPALRLELVNSHLGYTFMGEAGIRYFVTQLHVTNVTDEAVAVPVADFELSAGGLVTAADLRFPRLTGYEFRVGGKSFRFRDLERTETLNIDAGQSGSAWLVFSDLSKTQNVPQLDLRLTLDGREHHVNVTGHYEQELQLQVERIGPRDCLALLRIDGRLNSINVGTLVETIDRLGAAGLSRVVVGFGETARELDEPLGSWLYQTAQGVQTRQTYAMFPAVTSPIRELHVAGLPGRRHDATAAHVHDSVASAVEAALASAYRGLSPSEIAAEVEEGHPLAKAAALVNSGADLSAAYLPLLLERAASEDPLLRRGAFIALSGSGNPEGIQTLTEQAVGEDTQVAELALECLAASRFAGAHQALQQLLERPLAVDEAAIIRILARYPRPHWAEYLAQLALDRRDRVSADVRREVVLALGRIGHPQLTQILGEALASSDGAVQEAAFGLLLNRPDQTSEQLALSYALQQLAESPPTPAMLQLFDRARDPRVPPLLLRYLDEKKLNKSALINTLSRIGAAEIDDELANRFDAFDPSEQAAVLSNLTQLRSPRLLPLARAGLDSQQHPVFNAAVNSLGLQNDPEAVESLAARLAEETEIGRVTTLAKALEDIGLPEASRALDAARRSSSGDKRRAIARHYRSLQLKSPGGQYLQVAERHAQENEHQKALEYYSLALKRDPDMAPAYSGRGHAHLKLEDYKQAEADFRRSIELDEDDGLAVAGLGITLAVAGSIDEALRLVEEAGPRFDDDLLFAYNAACVYGRVLERVTQEPDSPQHRQRVQQLQEQALAGLKKSIELGFPDLDWMREDPDLASLRHLAEFQRIASAQEQAAEPPVPGPQGNRQPPPRQPPPPPVPGEN
jgi:tetratricopeptide (TPR) repeat protein